MTRQTIVSLLLACSLLIAFGSPHVASQTAVTSYQASMTSLTATAYSTFTSSSQVSEMIHYDLTPSDYNNRTGSFKLSFTDLTSSNLYGEFEDYPCLMYDYFLLNTTSGHTFRFHIQLSMEGRQIGFLILNRAQFYQFQHSNCGWGLTSSMLHVFGPSLNVVWVAPETGKYALVFATPVFYSGQVYYSAQEYSTVVQTQTSAATSTSIFEVTYMVLSTQTPTQTSTTLTGSGNSALQWLPVILILGLGVCIAVLLRRRR